MKFRQLWIFYAPDQKFCRFVAQLFQGQFYRQDRRRVKHGGRRTVKTGNTNSIKRESALFHLDKKLSRAVIVQAAYRLWTARRLEIYEKIIISGGICADQSLPRTQTDFAKSFHKAVQTLTHGMRIDPTPENGDFSAAGSIEMFYNVSGRILVAETQNIPCQSEMTADQMQYRNVKT